MTNNFKIITGVFYTTTFLFLFSFNAFAQKQWSIFIFLNGDNDLWEAALNDFNELEVIGSNDYVNVVVQIDLPGRFFGSPPFSDTRRYYIEKDADGSNPDFVSTKVWPESGTQELDMGDASTLSDFVLWGIENYPAEHYFLVLWDHGDGWKGAEGGKKNPIKSLSIDATSGSEISVARGDLHRALTTITSFLGRKIDIIGMDACLLGMWEVDLILSNFADFVVHSEETESGEGYDYTAFLRTVEENPLVTPDEFCSQVVRDSIESVGATLSCVDLSKMSELSGAIDMLAEEVINVLPSMESTILSATDSVLRFGDGDYADLYDIAGRLSGQNTLPQSLRDASQNVMQKVENAIIENAARGWTSRAKGISIYFPIAITPYSYDPLYVDGEGALWTDYRWDEMLCSFSKLVCSPDIYEPDNTRDDAKELSPLSPDQERSLFPIDDVDVAWTMVIEGVDYRFYTEGNLDTYMWLYRENGTKISEHDDISDNNKNSSISWHANYSGRVFVKVEHWGTMSGWGAETGNYSLHLRWEGCDLLNIIECKNEGLCEGTTLKCEGSEWVCPYPDGFSLVDDSCDGVDNDCDGIVDDDFIAGWCGQGECLNQGKCENGEYSCTPLEPLSASDDNCNGKDDDCDGLVDEDKICPSCNLEEMPECLDEGVCREAYLECQPDGTWKCIYPPTYSNVDDTPDGLDNDCDGLVDEDVSYKAGGGRLSCSIILP